MSAGSPPSHPRFWAGVFRFKGAWNCLLTVLLFFGDDPARDWLGVPRPDPAYRAMFLALAFVFGLGYWRVGQDLTNHRDTVRGGVLGQVAVFTVAAWEVFVARRLPLPFLVPGVVDLLFAFLFGVFLWKTRGVGSASAVPRR
jgi:hypothetical protein